MGRLYFPDYGLLEWLEPKDFYSGDWSVYDISKGEDGEKYAIVRTSCRSFPTDLRYTII